MYRCFVLALDVLGGRGCCTGLLWREHGIVAAMEREGLITGDNPCYPHG